MQITSLQQKTALPPPPPRVDPVFYLARRYQLTPNVAKLIAELAKIGRVAA